MTPYKDLFFALDRSHIRYLVAGGFAVNFHNFNRATADLDLILHLEKDNILAFDQVVASMGYVPRLPVSGKDLADPQIRETWIHEKNMLVFSYVHSTHFYEIIDIFVEEPKPFDVLYHRRFVGKAFGIEIPVVGLDDLIEMKENTGRIKDQLDIDALRRRHE